MALNEFLKDYLWTGKLLNVVNFISLQTKNLRLDMRSHIRVEKISSKMPQPTDWLDL